MRWFQHLFEFRRKWIPARYYCIDYRDLTRNPREAIEKLYQHFGWELSDAFRARLKAATERQRNFKSKHEYTLEEFGLSKAWIQEELGPCWITTRWRDETSGIHPPNFMLFSRPKSVQDMKLS